MLKENKGLTEVVLDENPIGLVGGRAVMRALRSICWYGWRREVSIRGCNCSTSDAAVAPRIDHARPLSEPSQPCFDPARPGGECRATSDYRFRKTATETR